ncbi:hypothetical protein PILCRDRAFT_80299 [Piloderma croceum F 1598]|uniref:CHAT domain-containing protein n=1 Tax=Piloderma croceum (strain F 1598) TaxID=765440 RepID=A0A0C3ENM6_PILCF|nr:hypothetical protein PILCRDRAFT_80299 [Piloderma croceum F 1598]
MYLSNLGNSFLCRFERSGDLIDVDKAISAHEQAVHLTLDGHANKPNCLNNLGSSLLCRFEHSGDLIDIDKAISTCEQAVHLTPDGHADKPGRLSNLGSSFLRRFECSGDLIDVDKAISAHKQAVHITPDGHADKPMYLSNHGNSFSRRFERSGDLNDVDKAISAHKQAVHLTPDGHANKPGRLNNLGLSFSHRFARSGDLIDIDKAISAISAHEQAVHLTPNGHANKPNRLNSLGNSFLHRFQRSGDLIDVDKAISAHEKAVHLTPDGHADKPMHLNNLGNSSLGHFGGSGDLIDVDKAISAHEQSVHLTPDGHANKPMYLNNLGNSFSRHFECLGDLIDVDKAISTHNQAVHLTPDGHAHKPMYLNNLGTSFSRRFECSGDLIDVDNAISAYDQAVHLTPDGHAHKPMYLSNLGNSFLCHFDHSGDLIDVDEAIAHFKSAAICFTGFPSVRFRAALKWVHLASGVHTSSSSALQGYSVVFDLLPQVAWLGQTILARHRELSSMGNVASEAAATAISAGKYDTALEWLEQGRSIVWSQLLDLRTPADAIREKEPGLADDLVRVSQALEHAGSRDAGTQNISSQSNQDLSMEQVAQGHRRLAEEWERLVERARAIPGFEDFLRPKKLGQLCSAANAGPVVVVNVHKQRCDALVLIPGLDEVMHIPLHDFSYEKGQELHQSLNRLLSNAGVRVRDLRGSRLVATRKDGSFQHVLLILWSCIVKPVLDGLAFSVSDSADPPRIWWCATGPLAFLPIHAAGIYDKRAPGDNISDYVVSSYTPTLNAIINATQSRELLQKFQGLLVVSQPNTPEQSPLPNTTVEMTHIKQHALDKFVVYPLEGSVASVKSVIEGMESHSWVHLACHAVQNRVEPTKSAFCLHDGHLELSTIITKQFPHADFAFLSACQTATGDEKLSEEAVHLAAGLLLAGYCGVIATMWSIKDEDAPVIADCVYSELFSDAEPDSTKAALALHHAVKRLREMKGDKGDLAFLSWVPFIHVGA